MIESDKAVEARMTPVERALYEKYRAQVGQEFVPEHVGMVPGEGYSLMGWGKDACWSWIKRWAIVNEDFNPLWFDEEYARASKWAGITAPPLYPICCESGSLWRVQPYIEIIDRVTGAPKPKYPNALSPFEAGSEWEFFEPVRPGDKIDCTVQAADIYWRQGKKYRLMFMVDETTYRNQKGQALVLVRNSAAYRWK